VDRIAILFKAAQSLKMTETHSIEKSESSFNDITSHPTNS